MDKETKKLIDELINNPMRTTLYDENLSDGEKLLMLMIEDHVERGFSTVSTKQLMRAGTWAHLTIYRYLNSLMEKNYIERVDRGHYTIKKIY